MLLYRYLLPYGLLLHIMLQYLCLFSLILQGLHEEGECRQLEFWAGKGANIRDLFCTTPKVLKLHKSQFWNILKILGEESTRGGPPTIHQGGGRAPLPHGPPGSPPMPIFWYKVSFALDKIRRKLSGWSVAVSRRNLGGTNLGLRRSCSAGETSLREGEIVTISSLSILSSGGGQSPSTSSPAPSPLKTLVHLLYPILYQNHKLVPVGC